MDSIFTKEPTQKERIMRMIIEESLINNPVPEVWDIECYPNIQRINNAGENKISEKDLLEIYQEIKKRLLPPVVGHIKKVSIAEVKNNELIFLKSSDIVSKPIDWLWKDKIAKGKVTLIAGDPGLGKSQTTIHIAGIVSTGGVFPGGSECKKGKVLFFSAEDDPEDTINPRLQAVNADRENIFIFSTVKKDGKEKSFDLSKDMDLLKKTVEQAKDVALIIVDPITAFLGETDSHVNAEVRALLSMLSKLASQYGIAIIVVTHLNKSSGGSPLNKITGSLAFVAAARAAYMVIKDENDESRRLFLPVKNNLAEDKGGFAFKVEGVKLDGDISTSRVLWEKEGVSMSAIEAMKEQKGGDGHGVDQNTIDRLEDILRRFPEGLTTNEYLSEAARVGISKRTVYRAEKDMFIERVGTGKKNLKKWKLVFDEDEMTNDATNKF